MVSHPIQYQAPLLRRISAEPHIDLRVIFERVMPGHRYYDEGFKREVQWDVPLTEGYEYAALEDTSLASEIVACDVLWVHGWQSATLREAIALASRKGKKVLMRGENTDMAMPDGGLMRSWLKRRYLNGIFECCDAFLSIGSLNRAYYVNRGIEQSRIFPMPYAVDNDAFAAAAAMARSAKPNLKEQLGIGEDVPVILFAGKLSRRKRPDILFWAMHSLGDISPAPALVFAGDGEMMSELQSAAPNAHFVGFVNQTDLPAYYAMADVFVLPSEKEPWGLAVNEAMACGTAVVVSDEVGCAADLVDQSTGVVFEAGDVSSLSSALRHAIANAEAMGKAAAERISGWNFEADVAGLIQALESVGTKP